MRILFLSMLLAISSIFGFETSNTNVGIAAYATHQTTQTSTVISIADAKQTVGTNVKQYWQETQIFVSHSSQTAAEALFNV